MVVWLGNLLVFLCGLLFCSEFGLYVIWFLGMFICICLLCWWLVKGYLGVLIGIWWKFGLFSWFSCVFR